MGGLLMPKIMHNLALPKVQLSEEVHHWTPDGSYGSMDFNLPIYVPIKLSSFDIGFLTGGLRRFEILKNSTCLRTVSKIGRIGD